MSEIKGEEKSIHALTIAYQFKQKEFDKHKKQLTVLEEELIGIREQMIKKCNHQWKYEPPAIYERGYYYCSICGTSKKITLR